MSNSTNFKIVSSHIALWGVALIYGANYTIAREVMQEGFLQPLGFIMLRVLSGAILFWAIALLFVREEVEKQDFKKLIGCSLFGIAVNQMFFFSGLKFTTPINAALIMTTTPLLVLLAAAIILKEPITKRKLWGIFLGLLGSIMVIAYGQSLHFQWSHLKGDLMVLVNALSYGVYLVLVKSLIEKYHAVTVLKWIYTIAIFFVLPFGAPKLVGVSWASFPSIIWWSIAFVLIMTSCVAYLLNAYALKSLRASVVGIYIFLQPVIATVVALSLGEDELSLFKIIAALLIFYGVYLVSMAPRRKNRV